jgi:hypothetical protein
MQFRGTVLDGERIVAQEVLGTYQSDSATGRPNTWSGRMSAPADFAFLDGETYTLRLADGREAPITISDCTKTDIGTTVWFKGKGRSI